MRFSSTAFLFAFCLIYGIVFVFELPVLGYYPVTGTWSRADLTVSDGTVMHWYGLLLAALTGGAAAGFIAAVLPPVAGLPKRLSQLMDRWLLLPVWGLMLLMIWLLRDFW